MELTRIVEMSTSNSVVLNSITNVDVLSAMVMSVHVSADLVLLHEWLYFLNQARSRSMLTNTVNRVVTYNDNIRSCAFFKSLFNPS